VSWGELGLPAECVVRDLWAHKDMGMKQNSKVFEVKPHAAGLYRVTPGK